MTPLNFIKQTLTLLTLFVVLMFAVTYNSIAEEKPSTLSGRVINANGEPLADSTVVLMYVKLRKYSGLDPLTIGLYTPFLNNVGLIYHLISESRCLMNRSYASIHLI
jgi:hypothetical protein